MYHRIAKFEIYFFVYSLVPVIKHKFIQFYPRKIQICSGIYTFIKLIRISQKFYYPSATDNNKVTVTDQGIDR